MGRETPYRGDAFKIVRSANRFGGSADGRAIAVLKCYLDDSGSSDLPVASMAGFVAPLTDWEKLEPGLDRLFKSHDIPVFHAKEFHGTKPPFQGWSKIRKRSLAEEIFGSVRGKLFGVSVTVSRREFLEVQPEMPNMSPVGVCFASVMLKVFTDPFWADMIQRDGISFLVESGGYNQELANYFDKMAKHAAFEGALRAISFIPKDSCRAVQLADFFAFYSRRHLRDKTGSPKLVHQLACPYLKTVERHCRLWLRGGFTAPKLTNQYITQFSDRKGLQGFVKSVGG